MGLLTTISFALSADVSSVGVYLMGGGASSVSITVYQVAEDVWC